MYARIPAYKGATGSHYRLIYKLTVSHPAHNMNGVCKVKHTTGETSPAISKQ